MNNRFGCGCDTGCQAGSAFVPVIGNWDFNMDGGCMPGSGCQRQRQNRCGSGEAAETACRCNRQAECEKTADCQQNACTGRADCPCERCMRRREAECGNAYTNCQQNACTGRADCPCERCVRRREADYDNCGKQKCRVDNRGVGIVWAKMQELGNVYDCGRALKAGTLYPELHKPMNGYWPCGESCGDKCQQMAFAMWELRLYLNTHPCDQDALAMLRKLQENCCEPNYATTFLEDDCACGWDWTDGPWPWECQSCGD